MPTLIAIFAANLSSDEVLNGARFLQETYPELELWGWVSKACKLPSTAEGRWSSYENLPSPSNWAQESIAEIVYFDRDPRFFTAPRFIVPAAKSLETVSYDVAQELIGFFNPQLHPEFIASLAQAGQTLSLTGLDGHTRIEPPRGASKPAVHSIVVKRGVILLSIATTSMWRQSGYLAKIFSTCSRLGVSVDQVSASESEVTLTLDGHRDDLPQGTLDQLLGDLSQLGALLLEEPCAAVTLVGRRIRSTLSQLSPVLARFEEERVHLIAQAAGDRNLTFVVDEAKSDKLVRDLHHLLFPLSSPSPSQAAASTLEEAEWWVKDREALLRMSRHQTTPFFLLHEPTVKRQLTTLTETSGCDCFLFAMKANHHPELLRTVRRHGLKFECVSPQEIDHLFSVFPDLTGNEILYTPNFASREDFIEGFSRGTYVTLDNHSPLEDHAELFLNRELVLRIDPGQGEGHHRYVKTAGRASKFGIDLDTLPRTRERLLQLECRVIGLHCHAGSGIRSVLPWLRNASLLEELLPLFPDVRFLDLGGGFGVPERPGDSPLDLSQLKDGLAKLKKAYPSIEIWLEPGRFIIAQAGVLLTRVTQVKSKADHTFVGVDAGMNSLIRPALYGAYHPIVNLSRYPDPRTVVADVVGPICESGDVLGSQRLLPQSRPGDLFLVANTGAYGRTMSSHYNLRPPARELWWTRFENC